MYAIASFVAGVLLSTALFIFCAQKLGRRSREKLETALKNRKESDKVYEKQIQDLYTQLASAEKTITTLRTQGVSWGDYNAVCNEKDSLRARLDESIKDIETMNNDYVKLENQLTRVINQKRALERTR